MIDVDITGGTWIGGLVGSIYGDGQINDSRITGRVKGNVSGNLLVGGLAGFSQGRISGSYSLADVEGTERVGGLVGVHSGDGVTGGASIVDSYSIGTVTATGEKVGGLVGLNTISSKIVSSYSKGSVTGRTEVGGLVGYNNGLIQDAYSVGSVIIIGDGFKNRLVVRNANDGQIINSFNIRE